MAPRPLHRGEPESDEILKANAEKLADFYITNLIDWSRPQPSRPATTSRGTQTDDRWDEHVLHIKIIAPEPKVPKSKTLKAKGKQEPKYTYTKGIGTAVIRLPKHTKGLGKVVECAKPKADIKDIKNKGKAVEPSKKPDATVEGKADEPSKPPDSKYGSKPAEPVKHKAFIKNIKDKERAVEPSLKPVVPVKRKADEISKAPDARCRSEAAEPPLPPDKEAKDKAV